MPDDDERTEDEIMAAELAEQEAGLRIAQSYEGTLDQGVIESEAKKSSTATEFADRLATVKREIDVKAAVDAATKGAEEKYAALADDMGLNDPPRYEKPEPEPDPDPEGHWQASEGDSWPVIAEHFNDGSMSLADYEREREARGMERLY